MANRHQKDLRTSTRIWEGFLGLGRKRLFLLAAVVITALILSNYLVQYNYEKLDRQMSSIYQDRLMPSHYLFQLQSSLLRKKMIQEHGELLASAHQMEVAEFDKKIDSIIRAYEKTYLTREEENEWVRFKKAHDEYEISESTLMVGGREDDRKEAAQQIEISFQQALTSLAKLNELQTREGGLIRESSKKLISGALLQSYLQISLVIILLALGISLISVSRPPQTKMETYN